MTDLRRDISLFVSVARIEAALHSHRSALQRIPQEIATIDKALADLDAREKAVHDEMEEGAKKRRHLERLLREHEDHLKKCRGQQSLVKTNEEYVAMTREIANLEHSIAAEEDEVLTLMDRIETLQKQAVASSETYRAEHARRTAERKALEERQAELSAESDRLARERPKILSEVSPGLLRRYERVAEHHRDLAVTRVEDEHCGACRHQVPPQVAVEVRKNESFITCQACGRILVHYAD
jgi:predicted  nucleic acid-binding Zn-ribbon protein